MGPLYLQILHSTQMLLGKWMLFGNLFNVDTYFSFLLWIEIVVGYNEMNYFKIRGFLLSGRLRGFFLSAQFIPRHINFARLSKYFLCAFHD